MLPNRRKQINANIAQSVECSLGKAEVTGSIPVVSSNNLKKIKMLCIKTNQKYKIKEAVELVYCFLKHPFEVVKFIEDEHLSSIVTLNILHAEEIYNAFYFCNQSPPKIYTINHQFSHDERFISYYISYDFIVIMYCVSFSMFSEEQIYCYSAMVIYKC